MGRPQRPRPCFRAWAASQPWSEALQRFSLSSVSTRLVVAVLATATIAFAASYGLTFIRLGQGLERQAAELGRLSEERLGQRLDGEARLAGAQLETLFETIGRRIESLAQRAHRSEEQTPEHQSS